MSDFEDHGAGLRRAGGSAASGCLLIAISIVGFIVLMSLVSFLALIW